MSEQSGVKRAQNFREGSSNFKEAEVWRIKRMEIHGRRGRTQRMNE